MQPRPAAIAAAAPATRRRRSGQRQRVVAPLAGDGVGAGRARADRTTMPPPVPVPRITPKTTRAPRRRAVDRLGQREAVGVVGAAHLAAEARARGRPPAAGRLSQVELAFFTSPVAGEMHAGHAHADASPRSPRLALQPLGQRRQRLDRGGVVAARRRHAAARARSARRVQRDALDLGAAEVESHPDGRLRMVGRSGTHTYLSPKPSA